MYERDRYGVLRRIGSRINIFCNIHWMLGSETLNRKGSASDLSSNRIGMP